MNTPPTESEFLAALKKVGNNKSAADAQVPAEYYKVLEEDPATSGYLRRIIRNYWCSGSWETVQEVAKQFCDNVQEDLEVKEPELRRSRRIRAPSAQAIRNIARGTRGSTHFGPESTHSEHVEIPEWDYDADTSGLNYEEWLSARMKLLPKKGDLHMAKNWRAVCLLDIASKILSNVLVYRMQKVQEAEGLEA